MRLLLFPLVVVWLTGCSGSGPGVTAASGASALGYAVVDAEAGVFFRARQPKRFRRDRSDAEFDVVTVTAARRSLTVLAAGEKDTADGVRSVDPSGAAEREAADIVAACTG